MSIIHRCFAALVILLTLAGALHAAEDVGDVGYAADSSQNGWTWICRHSAPIDGVIHSITARVASVAGSPQVVFKQFRNTSGNTFQLIDQSPTYTLEAGTVNYPVNFTSVLVGDYIGYYVSSTSDAYHSISGAGEYCYSYSGNHTTGSQTYTTRTNWMVPLLATIYEDDSGETFGDATLAANSFSAYTFVDEHTVPRDGTITAVTFNTTSRTGGQPNIRIKHLRRGTGNQFTVIQETAENYYATVGLATYPVNFTNVLEGDYIGYYAWGGVNSYKSSASGHTCYSYNGNHHSGTLTYTTRSSWMAPVVGVVYASGALEAFGSSAVDCGARLNNSTFVAPYQAPRDGHVVAMGLDIASVSSSPTIVFKHFRLTSGTDFQLINQSQTFTAETGMTIYDVDFPDVQEDDYFGYYTNNADNYRTWGGESCWSKGGNHTSGTATYTVRSGWRAPLTIFLANDDPGATSVSLEDGFNEIPQDVTLGSTITKSGGADFVTGIALTVDGGTDLGLDGSITSINSINSIDIDWTTDRDAKAGAHTFYISLGGLVVATGTVNVAYPQQLVSARQGGSSQEPPMNGTMVGNGVYAHNGEFRHDLPILSIPGRMLPLSVGLTYRSQLDTIGPVGAGWSASFDNRLTYSSGADEITLYSGGGRIDVFPLQSTGSTSGVGPYVLPGFFLQLWRDDNSTSGDDSDDVFTIKYAHGSTATYEAVHLDIAGQQVFRQTEFADRYSNAITFEYSSSGQLDRMLGDMYDAGTSTTRYALNFSYYDDGRLHKITDYADYSGQSSVIGSSYTGNREWEFVYDNARLTEIKLPKTERYNSESKGTSYRTRVQFAYDSGDNLLEVIDARQANESKPFGWLLNHYTSDKVDYQDVGRDDSEDTDHRQFIVYTSSTDVSVVDAEEHRSQYLLNADGTASAVKHYTGIWDSGLNLTPDSQVRDTDPAHFATSYTYDSEFHVVQVTYPLGNTTKYRYDIGSSDQRSRGNLLRVLSHKGSISTTYLSSDQEDGLLAKFSYTSATQFNLLATSCGPRAFEVNSGYNIVTDAGGGYDRDDSAYFTTTNSYYFSSGSGPDGTLWKTVSPTVDTTRSPGTLNNGQYLQSTLTYNSYGQLVTATDQASVETTYAYGSSGFGKGYLSSVSAGTQTLSPLTTSFAYNSVGRAITVTDPESKTYTTYVNQLDQSIRSETPQVSAQMSTGSAATYYSITEYDLNGNVETAKISNINEYGSAGTPTTIDTDYVYNILDMVTSVTEDIDASTTRTTSFSYDKIFRSTETTLPEGNKTARDYDEINRAIKSYAGYDGSAVSKSSALIQSEVFYDANSNVIKSVDGRTNYSQYLYDAYDRLHRAQDRLSTTAGDANYTEYTYNQAGQVTESVRMGKRYVLTGTGPDTYGFASSGAAVEIGKSQRLLDNIGRTYKSQTRARESTNTTNLGYSTYEGVTGDGWSTSTVKFRSNGQVLETYGDLGYATGYEYDSYNRLLRVIDDRDSTNGPSTSDDDNYDEYAYDDNGNVLSVTAHLYDDRGSSGDKTLTTTFTYDEINRLIEDTSPDLGSSTYLTREFKYDSRSNLVRTFDRKGVERITTLDLLGRPTRHQITDVVQRTIDSSGYLGITTNNIVSRTVYNKNSDVTQTIDTTGNRTYFRYDLADRWLQTQHADGGSGTPLKTTAGTTHSISSVGSTGFYSGTSTYDGNSNLLNLIDENNTTLTWTYDKNDMPLTESGAADSGNPFEIEGEAGLSYLYDGLYRAVYGETHTSLHTLTETDSVFNTLGGLERQRQKVLRAHPDDTSFATSSTVLSDFDESGRRFRRTNPGDLTRTTWDFDRKHRPTAAYLEYNSGGWSTPAQISGYQYLGGGLLHSRQTKYIKQVGGTFDGYVFPIQSDFEHDNLLRVSTVRHWRDDFVVSSDYRLLGRYDYGYDENSMMRWEARWHEDDSDGAGVRPDETDFYFYDTANRLEKAIYNATKYGSGDEIDLADLDLVHSYHFGDDSDNEGTYSDRIYYARRQTGTRSKVNWYRGAASRTSSTSSHNDTSAGPTQTTNYTTSESSTADADSPTGDGAGSRHNYTVIGQVGHTYDNNRNVLADGTREFRYNYKNQLRHVWRKSDGDTDTTGMVAKYREDAFGRRVYAEAYWELSRRLYLDTRFELDVDVDSDADSTDMKYVDGGLTSDQSPGPGDTDQRSEWDTFIHRDHNASNESWYFDFLVDVPEAEESAYIGYIAYHVYELRIYEDQYVLYNTGNSTTLGTWTTSTAGRHNIGIRAGLSAGVWIDGTHITSLTTNGAPALTGTTPVTAGFGTHDSDISEATADGLVLLENLNYIRSWNRAAEENQIPDGGHPQVSIYSFDGPRPVQVDTPMISGGSASSMVYVNDEENSSRMTFVEAGTDNTKLFLPNGRRTTGEVIESGADMVTYGEGGRAVTDPGEEMPGVSQSFHVDAVGAVGCYGRLDTTSALSTPFNGPTPSFDYDPIYSLIYTPIGFGPGSGPEGWFPGPLSSNPGMAMITVGAGTVKADGMLLNADSGGNGGCACRCAASNSPSMGTTVFDIGTGFQTSGLGGVYVTPEPGIQLLGGSGLDEGGRPTGEIPDDIRDQIDGAGGNEPPPAPFGSALRAWEGDGGADFEEFDLIGGTTVRYLKSKTTGKYYRHIRVEGDNTYWPSPATGNLSEYEVSQEVIDRLKQVKRGGLCLPAAIVKVIDGLASLFGLNDEIGLALLAYALGEYGSDEERDEVLNDVKTQIGIIAGVYALTLTAAAFANVGAPAVLVAGKTAAKKVLNKLLRKLRKRLKPGGWLVKKVDDVLDKEMKELASKLKFTDTVGKHMDEPWRTIPKDTLAEAILSGERMADPQGAVGAVKIVSTLTRNGKDYTLEIIYRESDSTILHALYK